MKKSYTLQEFPRSRIATFDTFSVGMLKHHVSALLEFDVTDSRKRLQELRRKGQNASFNGWIIKVISNVVQQHPEAAAFLYSKRNPQYMKGSITRYPDHSEGHSGGYCSEIRSMLSEKWEM